MRKSWFVVVSMMAAVSTTAMCAGQTVTPSAEYARISARVAGFERYANERQPPDKVMDAIGLKPGMTIGEIGAGYGRYTVHLSNRVGPAGRVYANDIDKEALAFVAERCRVEKLGNVETVLGAVEDPRLPKGQLDMVFMVWVYHMLDSPAALLKQIVPSLKPGATIVMVEPLPAETEAEIKAVAERTGKTPSIHVVTRQNLEADAAGAGLEVVKVMEGFLPEDNVFVLRARR